MMSKDKVVVQIGSGMGLSSTLFIVFLVLKLTETIDWSWWWVTAPLWIPITVFFGVLLLFVVFFVIAAIAVAIWER